MEDREYYNGLSEEQLSRLWGGNAQENRDRHYNFKCMMALLQHVKTPNGNVIDARFLSMAIAYHLVQCGFRFNENEVNSSHLLRESEHKFLSDIIGEWTPVKTMTEAVELISGGDDSRLERVMCEGWDTYLNKYRSDLQKHDRVEFMG